jgi:hypothetical protein
VTSICCSLDVIEGPFRVISVVFDFQRHVRLDRNLGHGRQSTVSAPNLFAEGNAERRTTINHAMKSCRRAWNVCARRNPGKLPLVNPFAQMGLRSSDRETPTAIFTDLQALRTKAVEMGLPSLATGALIGWEFLQRETDVFATFDVSHYRPKERPYMVRTVNKKTKQESWIPLLDDAGVPLYPELMAGTRCDQARAHRRPDAARLGRVRTMADMAEAGPTGLHAPQPQGEGSDPRRWLA